MEWVGIKLENHMENFEEKINELNNEMSELHFERFLAEDAWKLGNLLVRKAVEKNAALAIMIQVNQKKMFYYAFDQTDLNHERAVIRKTNVAEAFRCPSLRIFYELKNTGMTIGDRGRDPMDYLALGGAVPICLEQAGIIGTVCVSGMSHFEDHQFTVECMKEYLTKGAA